MGDDLFRAFCLMLVLEGLLPALAPARWWDMVSELGQANPQTIRQIGVTSMLLGACGGTAQVEEPDAPPAAEPAAPAEPTEEPVAKDAVEPAAPANMEPVYIGALLPQS